MKNNTTFTTAAAVALKLAGLLALLQVAVVTTPTVI